MKKTTWYESSKYEHGRQRSALQNRWHLRKPELECQTKLINLRDYQLLFCDGKDDESQFPKDVFRLREEVKQADGIILGTPSIMVATVAS